MRPAARRFRPPTPSARLTGSGLAMASPYGIVEANRTTAGTAFNRRGRACAPRNPHGARTTGSGLAMASPYGIVEVNQTTAGTAFNRRGRACAPRKPTAPGRPAAGSPWRAPTASSRSTEQPPEPRSTVGGAHARPANPSENQHARLNWYNGRFSENDPALHL